MWLNTADSALTETSILYTGGYKDGRTDRQANSSIPPKTFVLPQYNNVWNISGRGEYAGYKHFLLSLQYFQKFSSLKL